MDDHLQKYEAFKKCDLQYNNGLIVNQFEAVDFILSHPLETKCITDLYLTSMLQYAVDNSVFYRNYLGFHGIKDFPVVNKNILKKNYDDIFVKKFIGRKDNKIKHTSGSTGIPFEIAWDHMKHCRMIADIKWFAKLGGVNSHESIVCWVQRDSHESIPMEKQERDNVYTLFCTYFDDESIKKLLNDTAKRNPKGIIAYASMWDAVANYIHAGNAKVCDMNLTAIYAEAESMTERTRNILEEFFHCKVYSRYGNEECGTLAQEDDSHEGFFVNTASYFFELLNMSEDSPVKEGEPGRIVITDLFNHAFPIIRYDTGDVGSFKIVHENMYLSSLFGRKEDVIYSSDGKIVNQHSALVFMKYLSDVKQFQLVQKTYTDFLWILNTDNHNHENEIIENCREIFGRDTNYDFQYVSEIPTLKSGKVPRTVCKIGRV